MLLQGLHTRKAWSPRALAKLLCAFCLVTVFSWAGIRLSNQSAGVATVWLSNGILFGLLITEPPTRWLPYLVAGLLGDTVADIFYGDPPALAFGVSVANSVEVVVSSLVLTWVFGVPLDLSRRRPLVGFLLIAVLAATALASALGASWTLLFLHGTPWPALFRNWWLGDMLGMAVLAPLIFMLQRPALFSVLHPRHLPHTLLLLAAPVVATALVFTHDRDPLIFLLYPPLLLVAFRLGFPGTVLAIVLMTVMVIGFTVTGHGPLMLISGEHALLQRIVVAQVFAAVSIFTLFPVAALLEEQHELEFSLAASEARQRRLAHTDELTGLPNRRALNLRMEREWQRALLDQSSVALLLIDADHFKQYNDVFGHLAGDECLRTLAGVIEGALYTVAAQISRYGGEEFAVLLPGATLAEAFQTAEVVRSAVFTRALPHPTDPLGIQTVSVGAAALQPTSGQGWSALINLADEALYRAKLAGRNQAACPSRSPS